MKNVDLNYIYKTIGNKKVYLWGASLFLQDLLKNVSETHPNILGIIDKDSKKWGTMLGGYKIFSPDVLKPGPRNYSILVTVAAYHRNVYPTIQYELYQKYPLLEVLPDIFDDELSDKDLIKLQEQKINVLEKKFDDINTLLQKEIEFNKSQIRNNYNELHNAQIFNNLINNSSWVKMKDFIPVQGAATYSFLTILYIILQYVNPEKILEFGLGQTSKLTVQYAKYKNPVAKLQVVEHDDRWIEYFSSQLPENNNVVKRDIEEFELCGSLNTKYKDLSEITKDEKYNLIIIDGPYGYSCEYPRTNILELVPDNIADDFVIILDDYEREGEQNTAKLLFSKLDKYNIKYYIKERVSVKTQLIITSESYRYINFY